MYQSFENLETWKRSCRLSVLVYRTLEDFKDYTLKDQMTRAAISIPSNIAEGYERGTDREFIRFLRIAQGSAGELRTQAYIANSLGLLNKNRLAEIIEECKAVGAMRQNLAKARADRISESDQNTPDSEPGPGTP